MNLEAQAKRDKLTKADGMIPKVIIHLLSGGLDSVTLLYDLQAQGHSIHCCLFDYGQRHVQELLFAKGHCHRLGLLFTTITIPQLKGSELTDGSGLVVPFRNPIMLAHAVNLAVNANADTITIGCNADDLAVFKDCRWEVIDAMNHAIKLSGYSVEICAPYLRTPKWKVYGLARELGVPTNETWTCYQGGKTPCGKCYACVQLSDAMNRA